MPNKKPNDQAPIETAEQAAQKVFGLLGFARRAGKLTFGSDAVMKEVAGGRAFAVLLASDAAARTRRRACMACAETKTPCLLAGLDMHSLGGSIGRPDTAVVAVADAGFAKRMMQLCRMIEWEDDGTYDDEIPRARGGKRPGRPQ